MDHSFVELVGELYAACLSKHGITTPTEIQQKAIPLIQEGKHVVGCSQTGSGKTLAYLLPLFNRIDLTIRTPQALILTPTHELASQVAEQCKMLREVQNIEACLLIGGANITRQIEKLKAKPQIIVGSAGRVLELIRQRKINAQTIKTIVIDEADRMLDDLNFAGISDVIKTTQRDRKLLFFSATIDDPTRTKIQSLCGTFETIHIHPKQQIPNTIEHFFFVCEQRDKIEVLRKIIHSRNIPKALVFVNHPDTIENMVKRLDYHGIRSAALFGSTEKKGTERKQALDDFRDGRIIILVASDIAARGLDINGLDYIIHMDVPENPIFYLHRAGRCGRMDHTGTSILIATDYERKFLKQYEKKYRITIQEKTMQRGSIIDKEVKKQ